MVFRYIDRLRHEPLEVRRRAAVTLTAVLVGVILLVWLVLAFVRSRVLEGPQNPDSPQKVNGIVAPY